MNMATLELGDPAGAGETLRVSLRLNPGYGATAEVAHRLLTLCLTAAELPVVLDAEGRSIHLPRELLRSFHVWEEG